MSFTPPTQANFGNLLGGVAGVMQGIGGFVQAKNENAMGEYNAAIYEQQAEATRTSQALLEQQKRRIIKSQIGSQVAGYAASGIKYSGSPIEVALDSLTNANLDISIDRYNSEVQARGYQNAAAMSRYEGRQAAAATNIRTGNSLLTTAVAQYQSQKEIGLPKKDKNLGYGYGVKPY